MRIKSKIRKELNSFLGIIFRTEFENIFCYSFVKRKQFCFETIKQYVSISKINLCYKKILFSKQNLFFFSSNIRIYFKIVGNICIYIRSKQTNRSFTIEENIKKEKRKLQLNQTENKILETKIETEKLEIE